MSFNTCEQRFGFTVEEVDWFNGFDLERAVQNAQDEMLPLRSFHTGWLVLGATILCVLAVQILNAVT